MDGQKQLQRDLYPPLAPYEQGQLDVDGYHQLYWEQSGNPQGVPVVFLHGGPGAGCNATHRRFFDPSRYRIILFDQRGSGRSLPFADLSNNTTSHLVDDIETLRQFLNIDKWLVFGGSWGSTLALCYGISHPDRCLGFVLRGIFLGRDHELAWFLEGMSRIFPEPWSVFRNFLPQAERSDLLTSYYQRLVNPDPNIHLPAAMSWNQYETLCSSLTGYQGGAINSRFSQPTSHPSLALARIEAHYFVNSIFMDNDHILGNLQAIRHLPAVIVQGRYDIVCPITSAHDLSTNWPEADYRIIGNAGHSAMEPGIRSALVIATDHLLKDIG